MSNTLFCSACGTRFRSAMAEARHRHNFPILCKRNAAFRRWETEHAVDRRIEAAFRAGFGYAWSMGGYGDEDANENRSWEEYRHGGPR